MMAKRQVKPIWREESLYVKIPNCPGVFRTGEWMLGEGSLSSACELGFQLVRKSGVFKPVFTPRKKKQVLGQELQALLGAIVETPQSLFPYIGPFGDIRSQKFSTPLVIQKCANHLFSLFLDWKLRVRSRWWGAQNLVSVLTFKFMVTCPSFGNFWSTKPWEDQPILWGKMSGFCRDYRFRLFRCKCAKIKKLKKERKERGKRKDRDTYIVIHWLKPDRTDNQNNQILWKPFECPGVLHVLKIL